MRAGDVSGWVDVMGPGWKLLGGGEALGHGTDACWFLGNFGWDDVGSWPALERILPADDHGNVMVGNHVSIDTTGCIIHSGGKLVATIGVEDLIVVETDDVTLICKKERAQEFIFNLATLLQELVGWKRHLSFQGLQWSGRVAEAWPTSTAREASSGCGVPEVRKALPCHWDLLIRRPWMVK